MPARNLLIEESRNSNKNTKNNKELINKKFMTRSMKVSGRLTAVQLRGKIKPRPWPWATIAVRLPPKSRTTAIGSILSLKKIPCYLV